MKTLYLLRHAKAVQAIKHAWDPADDRNRPLTPSGIGDACEVGAWFARKEIRPGLALVSDATRTLETWHHLRATSQMDVPMRTMPELYLATTEQIIGLIQQVGESFTSLLIIGHNPGLAELAGAELSTSGMASAHFYGRWAECAPALAEWKIRRFR